MGRDPPPPELSPCTCAHHAVLRRIDAIDGKLEVLMRERRRSQRVLLSMREAATRLGIDRATTLADLVRSGQIKVVMKNTRPVIPATEVERLARDGFSTSSPSPIPRRPRRSTGKPGTSIRNLAL